MNISDEEIEPVYESIMHHYFTNPRLTVAEREVILISGY